jgi:hypothetical protein
MMNAEMNSECPEEEYKVEDGNGELERVETLIGRD